MVNAGIYLNQGIFILMVAFSIILIMMFHIKDFLVFFHQDEDVAIHTAAYMICYFPALLIYGISDLLRKFLNSFRMSMIPFLSFTVSVTFHPLWTYLFIVKYEYGIIGIAIAGLITNLTTFILIKIFILSRPQLKETKVSLCSKSTFDSKGLYQYVSLALPLIFTIILDNWVWE